MSLTNEIPPPSGRETPVGFEHWLVSEKERITALAAVYRNIDDSLGSSAVDFTITRPDQSEERHTVMLGEGKVRETARLWVDELQTLLGLKIPFSVA